MRKKTDTLIRNIFTKNLVTMFWLELSFSVGTLIDGVIICRFLGSSSMAAVGIDSPMASILAVFSGMIGIGCQAGCSKKIGEGKTQEANSVFSTLLAISVIISAAFAMIFYFFAGPIVTSWGAGSLENSEEIIDMASDYLKACTFGIPGMVIYYVISPALILDGKRGYIRGSIVVLMLSNILGDLLNVFVFRGGMTGMGMTTSLAYLLSLAVLLLGLLHGGSMLSFHFSLIRLRMVPHLLYLGLSKAVRRACNAVRPIFLNQVVAVLGGTFGITALSVEGNLRAFLGVISAAIAGTMFVMSGVYFYEHDRNSIQSIHRLAVRSDLVLAVPLAVLFVVFAPQLVSLYVSDSEETARLAVIAVRCYSAALPFVVFNEIYINYFQSLGNVFMACLLSFLSRVGMIAPCGIYALYTNSFMTAIYGLFLSELFLSAFIFLWIVFASKGKTLSEKAMFFPRDFGEDVRHEILIPTEKVKDALTTAPRKVLEICIDWGEDPRTANKASLFCEEFLTVLLKDSRNADRHVNIRIIEKQDGKLLMFFRNDCKLKNIEAEMDAHLTDREYMAEALSEKILLWESEGYSYKSTFGLNHISILVKG